MEYLWWVFSGSLVLIVALGLADQVELRWRNTLLPAYRWRFKLSHSLSEFCGISDLNIKFLANFDFKSFSFFYLCLFLDSSKLLVCGKYVWAHVGSFFAFIGFDSTCSCNLKGCWSSCGYLSACIVSYRLFCHAFKWISDKVLGLLQFLWNCILRVSKHSSHLKAPSDHFLHTFAGILRWSKRLWDTLLAGGIKFRWAMCCLQVGLIRCKNGLFGLLKRFFVIVNDGACITLRVVPFTDTFLKLESSLYFRETRTHLL